MDINFEDEDYKATLKALCDWYHPNKHEGPCQGDMYPRLEIKESWLTKSKLWEVCEVHEPDFHASDRVIATGVSPGAALRAAFATLTHWKRRRDQPTP